MVGRNGEGNQPARLRIERKLGVRDKALEESERGLGIGLGQVIHSQHRRGFRRLALAELLHRRANDFELGGSTPDNQALGLRIDSQPGVGHQGLQGGDDRARVGGVDRERVEPRLLFRQGGRFDLLQGCLDRVVLVRTRPDEQPIGFQVEHEFRVGIESLEHRQHALRIGRLDPIADQLALLTLGHLGFELFHDLDQEQVLGRLGPDHQLARLRLADDLHARHLRGQCRLEQLEPLSLGRRDRVHGELARLFRRRVGLELLHGRLDDFLILRRSHHHQTLVLGVERNLRFGDQPTQDGEQIGGWLSQQGMKLEHGRGGRSGFEL